MNSDKNLDSGYVKSYYDTFLSSYDKEYSHYRWEAGPVERVHFAQTYRTLLPYLERLSGNVLEVGGGDAVWTALYINRIESLTFLDISSEMVARAQKRLSLHAHKISYVNQDFLTATFPEHSFDNIVSIRNIEYFTDKRSFVKKVYASLKQGGSFVVVTKSPTYHLHDSGKRKTLHTSQIPISELIVLLREEGFQIEGVYPAIFGKLFRFGCMRFFTSLLHRVILALPWKTLPLGLLARLSESFLVYAKK